MVPRAAAAGLTRWVPGHVVEVAERPGADEEVAEDDEEAEHVLLRHHQHQAELDQVEPRADAGLHAVDDAPLAGLHILLGIGDMVTLALELQTKVHKHTYPLEFL